MEHATLEVYKCPTCGGALRYDADTGKLACMWCGNDFTTEKLEPKRVNSKLEGYLCPECGAELMADDFINGPQILDAWRTYVLFIGQDSIIFNDGIPLIMSQRHIQLQGKFFAMVSYSIAPTYLIRRWFILMVTVQCAFTA